MFGYGLPCAKPREPFDKWTSRSHADQKCKSESQTGCPQFSARPSRCLPQQLSRHFPVIKMVLYAVHFLIIFVPLAGDKN